MNVDRSRLISIITNAARMARAGRSKMAMWSFVSQLTGFGCTTSTELCHDLGIPPCSTLKEFLK